LRAAIDLAAPKLDDLPKTPRPEIIARTLVVSDSGAMWLGNERREFKPGTLIIIPKGVAHAGRWSPAPR